MELGRMVVKIEAETLGKAKKSFNRDVFGKKQGMRNDHCLTTKVGNIFL